MGQRSHQTPPDTEIPTYPLVRSWGPHMKRGPTMLHPTGSNKICINTYTCIAHSTWDMPKALIWLNWHFFKRWQLNVKKNALYRNNEDSFVDNLMLGVQLAKLYTEH